MSVLSIENAVKEMQEIAWVILLIVLICLTILWTFSAKCGHELCGWVPDDSSY